METPCKPQIDAAPPWSSFNGATTFQRWKPALEILAGLGTGLLQWGHHFSAMETARSGPGRCLSSPCFNGATTFQRWKRRTSMANDDPFNGFNGATTFQRWKRLARPDARTVCYIASMGPPLFSDGNEYVWQRPTSSEKRFNGATTFQRWKRETGRPTRRTSWRLQWGHHFSAMETYHT